VPRKKGRTRPAADWEDIQRPDGREIVFLDNNVLASEHGLEQIGRMGGEKVRVDFNQNLLPAAGGRGVSSNEER